MVFTKLLLLQNTLTIRPYKYEAAVESWAKISKILVDLGGTRDINKNQRQRVKSKPIEFSIQQDLYSVIYSVKR